MTDHEESPDRYVHIRPRAGGFLVSRIDGSNTAVGTRSEIWAIVHADDETWMTKHDRRWMTTRLVWLDGLTP